NLVAGIGCAADNAAPDVAWQLPVILSNYFLLRANWADWGQTCATGLAAARTIGDLHGQSRVLNALGGVHLRQGRLAESARCLRDAAAISRRAGETPSKMAALSNLGYTYGE